jgi:hypothetical protein
MWIVERSKAMACPSSMSGGKALMCYNNLLIPKVGRFAKEGNQHTTNLFPLSLGERAG